MLIQENALYTEAWKKLVHFCMFLLWEQNYTDISSYFRYVCKMNKVEEAMDLNNFIFISQITHTC